MAANWGAEAAEAGKRLSAAAAAGSARDGQPSWSKEVGWLRAVVPGTVIKTWLHNGLFNISDPYYEV